MAFFLPVSFNGQLSTDIDTIKIKEVVISIKRPDSDPSGFKKTKIDSSTLVKYSNRSLSDMLSENTGIFIKSYGMGGTATVAFRGTTASHTIIAWNGININSPMLGQSDLSLFPLGLIDDVNIYYGGASMQLNNGGIGGTINLETGPVWNKETLISLNSGIGSFGSYSGLLKVKTGNYKFQTVTKVFLQGSENDFRYLNTQSARNQIMETRKNNQVFQQGFVQEFYYRNSDNLLSARIWYQSADRNLSHPIGIPDHGEKQFDQSFRSMLNYDKVVGKSTFSFNSAWVMDRMNYFNRVDTIDSRNLSKMLTLKAGFENPIGDFTKLKIVLNEQSNVINSVNYANRTVRNTASATAIVEWNKARIGTTILVREILDRQTLLIPDFSAGLQLRLIQAKEYYLKVNLSRNSKIPTMNDLFYGSGGNPDLKNEYSLIYEISYEMNQKISIPLCLKYNLTFFNYAIDDMIQWQAGEHIYWTAENIKKVKSSGAESSVSVDYKYNKVNATLKAGYILTLAKYGESKFINDNSSGKQLMYVPENQANASLRMGYKKFYASWVSCFTGRRYTASDNSAFLPGYFINNIMTGMKMAYKSFSVDVNFNIDNLFDVNYQSIANYPLPGRSYNVKILFQLVK
jgi:outer membrane cobalamin receptor